MTTYLHFKVYLKNEIKPHRLFTLTLLGINHINVEEKVFRTDEKFSYAHMKNYVLTERANLLKEKLKE